MCCNALRRPLQVWLRYIQHLIGKDKEDASRKILERALNSLPKHKHFKVGPRRPPLLRTALHWFAN